MARITNIHDSFFKRMFSDVANVRALLEIVLPPAVLQELELSHLQLEP
ncbi:MAG: ISNCY family transposase, partial [Calditrichaeota bacterium]